MPRQDIFTFIHKGIRSMIYDQGKKLMQTDFADPENVKSSLNELSTSLKWLEEHGKHEESFVFPAVTDMEKALVDTLIEQHHSIHEMLHKARNTISRIREITDTDQRVEAGVRFNREFNSLAAFYLEHMNREEAEMLPVTWQYLTDEQIVEIRNSIQKNIAPDDYREQISWAIGATNNTELIGLLKGLKASAPPEVVRNILGIAEKALPEKRLKYILQTVEM